MIPQRTYARDYEAQFATETEEEFLENETERLWGLTLNELSQEKDQELYCILVSLLDEAHETVDARKLVDFLESCGIKTYAFDVGLERRSQEALDQHNQD